MQETILSNFETLSNFLTNFLSKNKTIYLKCEPEIIDFRKSYNGRIFLIGKEENISFTLPDKHFASFISILVYWVFGDGITIYSWDIKRLFSYFHYRWESRKDFKILANFIDIKYGEHFLGIHENCPETYLEAEKRANKIASVDCCMLVHKNIHLPLAINVLPKIETSGICDSELKKIRYSAYRIEGQSHGRLKVSEDFDECILIHNLTNEMKAKFCPKIIDGKFILFDYKAMEVFILEWLSKDIRLGKIIESGRDIYHTIYSLLYNCKSTAKTRQFIKDVFLPIIYGMQYRSLSARINISEQEASEIILKINKFFSGAMGWMEEYTKKSKNGNIIEDYFGRPRLHDKYWVVRNAIIQGPAAIICLEKLIELQNKINVLANIHDGYLLESKKNNLQETIIKSLLILETPSNMCEGLKLRVGIRVGDNLLNLEDYKIN